MLKVVREATKGGEVLDEEDEAVVVGEEETLGGTLREVLTL